AQKIEAKLLLVQAVDSLAQRLATPVNVVEAPGAAAANVRAMEEAITAEKQNAEAYLTRLRDRLAAAGLTVEVYVGEGSATDVILSLAQEQGASMIAMSTHGRGGLGRLVFGSVADAVLRNSPVPVLLVRSGE